MTNIHSLENGDRAPPVVEVAIAFCYGLVVTEQNDPRPPEQKT